MDCKYSSNPATMYMDGCLPRTVEFLRENAVYVGVIAIIVAFIMVCVEKIEYSLFFWTQNDERLQWSLGFPF